jgi:hypothetical protein
LAPPPEAVTPASPPATSTVVRLDGPQA